MSKAHPQREELMEEASRPPLSPKEEALEKFRERKANPPKQIDNSSLYAGSPMYYYCRMCGHESDVLPEDHYGAPRRLCRACETMKDMGWFD
jgi:hypothetical protein